jgi:hypothetical protein
VCCTIDNIPYLPYNSLSIRSLVSLWRCLLRTRTKYFLLLLGALGIPALIVLVGFALTGQRIGGQTDEQKSATETALFQQVDQHQKALCDFFHTGDQVVRNGIGEGEADIKDVPATTVFTVELEMLQTAPAVVCELSVSPSVTLNGHGQNVFLALYFRLYKLPVKAHENCDRFPVGSTVALSPLGQKLFGDNGYAVEDTFTITKAKAGDADGVKSCNLEIDPKPSFSVFNFFNSQLFVPQAP